MPGAISPPAGDNEPMAEFLAGQVNEFAGHGAALRLRGFRRTAKKSPVPDYPSFLRGAGGTARWTLGLLRACAATCRLVENATAAPHKAAVPLGGGRVGIFSLGLAVVAVFFGRAAQPRSFRRARPVPVVNFRLV